MDALCCCCWGILATSLIMNPRSGILVPSNTKKGSYQASFFLRREVVANFLQYSYPVYMCF